MAVFLISTSKPDPDLPAVIDREFPGRSYKLNDTAFYIRANGTAIDIAGQIGVPSVKSEEPYRGPRSVVVNRVTSSYWGHHSSDLWDWLKSAMEADS